MHLVVAFWACFVCWLMLLGFETPVSHAGRENIQLRFQLFLWGRISIEQHYLESVPAWHVVNFYDLRRHVKTQLECFSLSPRLWNVT